MFRRSIYYFQAISAILSLEKEKNIPRYDGEKS